MSADILERRYRALLRSYPADYRRERADELLDVLVTDDAGTRRWPELRQAVALIRGGLRVRAGSAANRPTVFLAWQGVQLAALAVLALGVLIATDDLVEGFQFGGFDAPLLVLKDLGPNLILSFAALVALVLGRQRLAIGLIVAAVVVQTALSQYLYLNGLPQWWAPVVALPLVVAGRWRPADVPQLERGNAALVTAGVVALHLVPIGGLQMVDPAQRALAVIAAVLAGAVFLWFATADQRLLIAAAPTFALTTLHELMVGGGSLGQTLPFLAVGVALVICAVVLSRRRAARV
ncbi:hypothetical protein BJY16_005323 [Actinoplanes octamycinicus]|uniref:Uncharacterized protein n=1 Tax=Actinoplanes octamycinicus TaxID=135948 RepID=A0A7W7H0T3_9ACTN|nr:hypothetical protein [Actinoplanes octamycinicus]MBB4741864.1 hypothetical protein [Actinoplanes octamycinicus]GIE60627.1 hypothetical protein Aoc01nite_60290 [Actinoplanes octamycinicus]